jgi:hypothetical protein
MNRDLAAALLVALRSAGVFFALARMHWRMPHTPETVRQALFLGGMGAGLVAGLCIGAALGIVTEDAVIAVALPPLLIGGFFVVGLAGHLLGRWLEKRRDRRCPLAEDYGDPSVDDE